MTDMLETLRAEARAMTEESDALTGWFTKAGDRIGSNEFFTPARDVFSVVLRWDRDRVFDRFNPPVSLSILPLIWHGKKVHIGGHGWRRMGQRQSLQYLAPQDPGWTQQLAGGRLETPQPVGWLYLVFDRSGSPYSIGRRRDLITSRALEMAVHMLRWHKAHEGLKGDYQVQMPALALSEAPRRYLKMRDSKEVDQQVLSCARHGTWNFVTSNCAQELHSPVRGKARFDADKKQVVVNDRGQESVVDQDGSEHFLEEAILLNFGKYVHVSLQPALDSPDGFVQEGQSLFRPIEARDWSLEELKARQDWPVLAHLAAFVTSYRHADKLMFNCDLVEAEQAPWVDGRQLPACKSVLNVPQAFQDRSGSGEMDLHNTPLRQAAPATMRRVFRVG